MKKTQFSVILSKSWAMVADEINKIEWIINEFKKGRIQAAKARRMYHKIHKDLCIDANRYVKILKSAKEYNSEAFRYWTDAPIYKAMGEFYTFFGR